MSNLEPPCPQCTIGIQEWNGAHRDVQICVGGPLCPRMKKPKSGGFVPGPGISLTDMIPLFGEHTMPAYVSAPRAIPRSAYMDRLPGESYFTLADRFIAPFVHISLRAINVIVPALDRRLNARQRRRIRRTLAREMNKAAAHALMYGRM